MSETNDKRELTEGIFPNNVKIANQYQWRDPRLKSEYEIGTYQTGSFCGGSNKNLTLITCEDKIIIMLILQGYQSPKVKYCLRSPQSSCQLRIYSRLK